MSPSIHGLAPGAPDSFVAGPAPARRWLSAAALSTLVLGGLAGEARADVLAARVEAHAGAAGGAGLGGAAKDEAFFDGATGATYGVLVGIEALFVEGWVEHHQYVADDFLGTWSQAMIGLDLDFERRKKTVDGKEGKRTGYLELGIAGGFGVGTGQQVDPPLDASEVTDRGLLLEARFGAGWVVGNVIGIGFVIPVSGGYFIKSGFANEESNHYYGVEASAMLVVRGKIKIK